MSHPQALFEISWEVANMVGGIHTVLATKVHRMQEYYGDDYVAVGPDISRLGDAPPVFREEIWLPELFDALGGSNITVRMGRWLIPGEPRCLLVNSSNLFPQKDKILAVYWEKYQLDSLFGGWDFVEPLLFSHAAGHVIGVMARRFLLPAGRQVVAHCHEWMSCGAILHLRDAAPEVGTVFTAHATVLGRALASQHRERELYDPSQAVQPDRLARELNVVAKHSLESVGARLADAFTTVSTVTAEECRRLLGRSPDVVTPNALGEAFPDPRFGTPVSVQRAREKLFDLAELVTGDRYNRNNTDLVVTSGRYEYVNKGLDVLLEALRHVDTRLDGDPQRRRAVAFIFVPAGHQGPRRDLLKLGRVPRHGGPVYLTTHDLRDEAHDPVVQKLAALDLKNQPGRPVHVVYVPIYLDGTDPLIPETYYEFLAAADLGVFPSFYEPWGYTPLECVGYGVPTVTSDLAGFGKWVERLGGWRETGSYLVRRLGRTLDQAAAEAADVVTEYVRLAPEDRQAYRDAAATTGRSLRWSLLGAAYFEAEGLAAEKAQDRLQTLGPARFRAVADRRAALGGQGDAAAHMRSFVVRNDLPRPVARLRELAGNLWWSWRPDVERLFADLDPALWLQEGRNPRVFLEEVAPDALVEAAGSESYLKRLHAALAELDALGATKPAPEIAYFCAEFGLGGFLKIYAGGLGILAGDFLKAASDAKLPVVGVGLAYRNGYFRQRIAADGSQEAVHDKNDFAALEMAPVVDVAGKPVVVSLAFPGGPVHVRAWRVAVGRVDLYLLDTDFEMNRPAERAITSSLYPADPQSRLRQELLLGSGGVKMLTALGVRPKVYHMNEGHSAFLVLRRMVDLIRDEGMRFHEALEYVRHTTVFTTHTPVPAGHDRFTEDLLRPYLAPFLDVLHKDWPFVFSLGRAATAADDGTFSMTHLAVNASLRINGVSEKHGEVSREMFQDAFPGALENEVPVTSVTNGVHVETWVGAELQRLFDDALGAGWREQEDAAFWSRAREIDAGKLWRAHLEAKRRLLRWLDRHIRATWPRRLERPSAMVRALANLNENALIIGFARRFAPYKRGDLLLRNPDRFADMLESGGPILFLYAGKAHPADTEGQAIIKRLVELSRQPRFVGKLIFVENYDLDVARLLVAGSDVWLNTPVRPLEASGTSGMKAGMNGCLNLSVGDGWWLEGFNEKNGWMIGEEYPGASREYQDEYDGSRIDALMRQSVIPMFHQRDRDGVPREWVTMMRESIASLVPVYSARRMVREYGRRFYEPAVAEASALAEGDYAPLMKLNEAERRLRQYWDDVSFADVHIDGLDGEHLVIGRRVDIKTTLRHPSLAPQDLRVQAVTARVLPSGSLAEFETHDLAMSDGAEGRSTWSGAVMPRRPGHHSLGIRILPQLGEGQAHLWIPLVKWL